MLGTKGERVVTKTIEAKRAVRAQEDRGQNGQAKAPEHYRGYADARDREPRQIDFLASEPERHAGVELDELGVVREVSQARKKIEADQHPDGLRE